MIAAVPLLLAGTLGAGGSLDLGIRGEGVFRWVDPAPSADAARSTDATVTPRLGLRLFNGPASALLVYRPRLTVRDIGPNRQLERYHEGELRLRLEPSSVFRLEAYGEGSAGRTDLVTQGRLGQPQPGQPPETIPTTAILDVRNLRVGLSARIAPGRRGELLLNAYGAVDGGADAESRASLPVENVVGGSADWGYSSTRVDRLGLLLTGEGARVPDLHGESAWASLMGTWRHRTARDVELSSGLGAVVFYSSYPDAANLPDGKIVARNVKPAAMLGLSKAGGPHGLATLLGLRLGATNDRVTGRATQSLDGDATLTWPASTWLGLHARWSGSLSGDKLGNIRRGGVDAGATFIMTPHAHLDLGGYGTWQQSDIVTAPSVTEYGATLALTLTAPTIAW
jgi:hypothetical protein